MAALPSPTQIAGKHSAIYESYYSLVDPNGVGTVGALEAARFLKRSGLSDVVLSRIWDLSDPGARGCLDKAGLFVALKLVSVAQQGRDVNIENVLLDIPPPKMGDLPLPKPAKPPLPTNTPLITSVPPTAGVDWTIKPNEREKYDKLFDSLNPSNGLIPGNKVKGVLMDSKLPLETLGKIWDLADQDKDGMLDRHEFIVAMHLVYKALEKHAVPNTLPPELLPPAKRKGSSTTGTPIMSRGLDGMKPVVPSPPNVPVPHMPPPVARPPPPSVSPQPPVAVGPTWVVTPDERAKYDLLFVKSDVDRDGFVSGAEIKNVFLQSGVPQAVLAHIWALCDIKQSGKLNNEQFALAMWLVGRCLKGIEPPPSLTPEMVPPSFRAIKPDGIVENNNTTYSNPELDMISKDIEELSREKIALEADIQQKEADIKIKNGEIKSLQVELDTLAATLKQLENQKGEAQKRLNDLRAQRSEVDKELEEVSKALEEQKEKVDKLRTQATEQAEAVASQEAELNSKKQQLESLKQDEQMLEQRKNENAKKLENLTSNLQETQLTISQVKAMITQLQEQTRQMNDAITICDSAIDANDPNVVPDGSLRITPDFRGSEYKKIGLTNGHIKQNGFKETNDPFSKQNGPVNFNSGFQDDPFKADPFKNNNGAFESSQDPFTANFSNKNNNGFQSDPFDSFNTNADRNDPFDAFHGKEEPKKEEEKDPFGCDPFAVLHAPTRDGAPPPRPTSPSPALPPKKSKQPPPRPAPPRPNPPSKTSQNDPFGSAGMHDPFSSGNPGGFADFADFDAKFSDTSSTNFNNSNNKSVSSKYSESTIKSLDFTDDPFRDYRYEDPFDITFDDDPEEAPTNAATTELGHHQRPIGSLETLKSNASNLGTSTSSLKARTPSESNVSSQWKMNTAPWKTITSNTLDTTKSSETGAGNGTSSLPDINKFDVNFDPFGLDTSFNTSGSNNNNNNNNININKGSASSFDPFGLDSGRQSVPLPTAPSDPVGNRGGRVSAPLNKTAGKLTLNEDQQLAWAARESLRLEEARKQRQIQEEADLELAIALSKAESQQQISKK